jgi:hypothetical protein
MRNSWKAAMTVLACGAAAAAGATVTVQPFSARYQVEWKGINVGTSDLTLSREPQPDRYLYVSRSNARGIFHLMFSDEVMQSSLFTMTDKLVQPLKFKSDDGSPKTDKDVVLDFDWQAGRVTGTSEDKHVDMPLRPGVQDVMSVQIVVMQDLLNDRLSNRYLLADKDEIKEYLYAKEGTQKLATSIGDFDTVIVTSRRPNTARVLRMWFAPSLHFVPVRAERTRNGKLEFAMRIKRLQREGAPILPAGSP